jgi:hypothetical protein
MDIIERLTKEDEIAVEYDKEFIKNGLRNITLSNKKT